MSKVDDALNHNFYKFMRDGPGLSYDYKTPVLAVCGCGYVLLGGLGGMGVGEMWFKDDGSYKDYIGYGEAERVKHTYTHDMPTVNDND